MIDTRWDYIKEQLSQWGSVYVLRSDKAINNSVTTYGLIMELTDAYFQTPYCDLLNLLYSDSVVRHCIIYSQLDGFHFVTVNLVCHLLLGIILLLGNYL